MSETGLLNIEVQNRSIIVETSKGECAVRLGEWEGIGGIIPNEPHLLDLDELIIVDAGGNVQQKYQNICMLVCHGHRPNGLLTTLKGHPIFEIVNGLREKGMTVDALGVCEQLQTGEIQVYELETALSPPVIYNEKSELRLILVPEAGGWAGTMWPKPGGSVVHEPFGYSREVGDLIKVRVKE